MKAREVQGKERGGSDEHVLSSQFGWLIGRVKATSEKPVAVGIPALC
jgi:hypothetical protein